VRLKASISLVFLTLAFCLALAALAKTGNDKDAATAPTAAASHAPQDDPIRLEGEKRFRANCGRCHAAPPRFAPRMMATIVRHMRVRATITDQDAHLILHYMTQ
jgi:cytochrome c5